MHNNLAARVRVLLLVLLVTGSRAAPAQVFAEVEFFQPLRDEPPPIRPPASVQVPRVGTPPTIDGVLDEPGWRKARPFSPFVVYHSPTPAEEQRTVLMTFDWHHLYVGVRLEKQAGYELLARVLQDGDTSMWKDDELEIFLDPGLHYDTYYQIIINAAGRHCAMRHHKSWVADPEAADPRVMKQVRDTDRTWDSGLRYAVNTGGPESTEWVIELALPVEALGLSEVPLGSKWGVNVSSNNRRTGELTNWMPGDWHDPRVYGQIGLGESLLGVSKVSWGAFRPGLNRFQARFENLTDERQEYTLAVRGQAEGSVRFALAPGESADQGLGYEIAPGAERVSVVVQLRDQAGELLFQTQVEEVMPPLVSLRVAPYGYLWGPGQVTGSLAVELGDRSLADAVLEATLMRGDAVLAVQRLRVEGSAARFSLDLPSLEPGRYKLRTTLRSSADEFLGEAVAEFGVAESPFAAAGSRL